MGHKGSISDLTVWLLYGGICDLPVSMIHSLLIAQFWQMKAQKIREKELLMAICIKRIWVWPQILSLYQHLKWVPLGIICKIKKRSKYFLICLIFYIFILHAPFYPNYIIKWAIRVLKDPLRILQLTPLWGNLWFIHNCDFFFLLLDFSNEG